MKRHNYIKFILVTVTMMICLQGHATPISLERARSNALTFLSSGNMKRVKGKYAIKQSSAYEKGPQKARRISSEEPAFYVFNLEDGGFILASGDDCTDPILAYGESGEFNLDSIPANVKVWIDGYAEEISWAREQGLTASDLKKAKSNAPLKAKSTINYMLKSTWNQDAPFNDQCIFNGKRCYTGCGATAMAQILYYWAVTKNAFRHGCKALPAYTTYTNSYNVSALGSISSFNWGNMINGKPSSATNKEAVAQLMRYCGQSVKMDYTPDWSASSLYDIYYSLKDNFFYNSSMTHISNDEKTGTAWNDMVYNELAAGRPVIIAGYKNNNFDEGHLFICDGYNASTDKYHINWGWGGWCDNWFAMSALNPSGRNYNFQKEAIIGIQPTATSQYVVLSSDKKTLSFYCDNKKYSRSGTLYDLSNFMYNLSSNKSTITSVVFDASFANARPTSTNNWFYGMTNLATITNIGYLNTSNVKDMHCMFENCKSLKSINLSQFNTAYVTNMSGMFNGCTNLGSVDLSKFNTAKVTDMGSMFQNCQALKSINLSLFNTASVTNMNYMFKGCSNLGSIDLSKFNMSKVTSSSYMLGSCKSLKSVTISSTMDKASSNAFSDVGSTSAPCVIIAPSGFNFGVSLTGLYFNWKSGCFFLKDNKVSYALLNGTKLSFFHDASPWSRSGTKHNLNTGTSDPTWKGNNTSITEVSFDASFATARPTSTSNWFIGMTKLATITNIGYLNTSNVTNMKYMFQNCQSLKSINLSKFNTAKVTDMSYMFDGCSGLTSISFAQFDMTKVSNSNYMVRSCTSLTGVTISATMTKASSNAFSGVGSTSAPCIIVAPSGFDFGVNTTGMYFKWKSGYFFLKNNKVSYAQLDGSKLSFFHDASPWSRNGTKYPLNTGSGTPEWNGSKASITEVSFDASFASATPTTTYKWFEGMTKLATITNIGYLKTTSVTNMGYMFQNCQALKSINLSQFNTASVTDMCEMFSGCINLGSIDLSKFNTAKVTNMGYMFQNCQSLKTINLSLFNTASVTNMSYMFSGCSNLESIDLSKFNMSKVTLSTNMLESCKSLKSVSISSTMSSINSFAFSGVGSTSAPCIIVAPSGFDFGVNTTGMYFKWKSGYFFLKNNKVSYALLDGNKLSFFHDASPWSRSGTKYPLNTGTGTPGWNGSKASITEVSFDASFANAAPTTTYKWFEGMTNLATITNIGYLTTSNVTNMSYMFQNCNLLKSINLSKFNTAKVTNMSYMFDGCSGLTSISFAQFDMTNVSSSNYMVRNCTSLTGVTISATMTNVHTYAFSGVGSTSAPCIIVAPSGFDFGKDLTGLYFNWKSGYFFLKDNKVTYALLDDTKLSFFHDASPWSRNGTKHRLNTGTSAPTWNGNKASITEVSIDASFATAKPTSTYKWFEGMTNLVSLSGMNYLDMSNVTNDGYMFYGCSKLTSIPIPASAKSIDSYMFEGCSGLTSVDIPNGVTSIGSRAFYGCSNMTNTNIPVSVTRIDANAFNGCDNQVEVKVGFSSPMSIVSTVFTNRKNAILIVPAGCKDAFASEAYWKEFKGIFEDKEYAIGDVNHDDDVNVTDASILVDFILGNKQEFFFIESADYDKNGIINVSDVTNLVDIILSK